MRFNAWICKRFNVLPSNPDFQNLTEEQKEWLWEDYLLDNPDIKRKIENAMDEEFEEDWNNLDNADDVSDLERYKDVEYKAKDFLENDDGFERSEEAKRILEKLNQQFDVDDIDLDWEEVDD